MEHLQIISFLFLLLVSIAFAGLSFSTKDGGYLQYLDNKGDFNFYSYIKEFGQFEYKNTDQNVQYGCYGYIEPLFNMLKTTFYVADARGTRNFRPFENIEVYQNRETSIPKTWEQLPLPGNCRLKEITNPTPPPRLKPGATTPTPISQSLDMGLFGNSVDDLTKNCPCLEVDGPTTNNLSTFKNSNGDTIPVLFIPYCAADMAAVGNIDQDTLKKYFQNSLVPYKCSRCTKK